MGIGLTTGFIGSHTVTHLQPSLLQLQLTLTAESLQGPGPPADPTGSHWPSTNSSGTHNWNCTVMAVDVRAV
jgi:hypothetical protein